MRKIVSILLIGAIWWGCQEEKKRRQPKAPKVNVPNFNADSAFSFVKQQVSFGPRVPNTPEHEACATWLANKLTSYGFEVTIQEGEVTTYHDSVLQIKNIIGALHPERKNRGLLFAHWDTRPFADQDVVDKHKPILGANDGASGVAVLLEIARQLSIKGYDKGLDIIFFDAEDYGPPSGTYNSARDAYCLGTQYWTKQPHKKGYSADYGILLDMVGAPHAQFCMEGTSMRYAPSIMRQIWNIGASIGYRSYFCFDQTEPITDDHLYVNVEAGIPSIDIIDYDRTTPHHFGAYWHTHRDNLDAIDAQTLKAVGQTLITFLYRQ